MDDSSDEIEQCQSIGPHELVESVKSKTLMKLSPVQLPAHFNRLECNTNLNLPPSNWLTTSSHGLHQALYQSGGFASFRLGQMFPDCVGEVDVVSDAENIKKLLKLPYTSKGVVSMIVHKVGNNTLLLDEFDIQKYLLRKADDDWKWLRTFILEQVLAYGDKEPNYCIKDKSREALQTKNLLSKFLYYSLKQTTTDDIADANANEDLSAISAQQTKPNAATLSSPVLPEAKEDVYVPDPKSSHAFNRNVVWTFEDIRMLIGTNFPIFGGKNRPCVSLRLRDMKKPINVLTGIDYWLDNLMCNVPEVVMCYHLDGIVQKYEIIKTEDLPYLEDSEFSPQVVRNVAQNILAFLKANATKAGHTYWLFKGRNDDVVKLYDLTTLCKQQTDGDEEGEEKQQANPFTVPVGMLLYTVARNMKKSLEHITPKTAGNIRALLDNCIKLLPKEKYPQIVTSSHYILSDLHIPAGIDPKAPNFDEVDSDEQSLYDDDEEESPDLEESVFDESNAFLEKQTFDNANVAMQHICDTLKEFKSHGKLSNPKPEPLLANTEERCVTSLQHISAGISCLQYFNTNQEEQFIKESEARAKEEEKQRILHEEQNPNMAKPFNPIPLPYETLQPTSSSVAIVSTEDVDSKLMQKQKKSKQKQGKTKDLQVAASAVNATPTPTNQQLSANFNNQHFGSWNVHLKLLLLEKACLTYATLAEHNYEIQRYGASLNAIYMSCRCQLVVSKYMSSITSQQSCLLGRAGDCFFQMAKNWDLIDEFLIQFNTEDEHSRIISAELEKELKNDAAKAELNAPVKNVEHLMCSSCKCYEQALEAVGDAGATAGNEILRRLGNVRNELGLKYMYWAQEEYSKAMAESNAEIATEVGNTFENDDETKQQKSTEPVYVTLAKKSYDCLRFGIEAFTLVEDNVNLAFLYCNMGRFMRLRAHLTMPEESTVTMESQKTFYKEAFAYYEKAKDVLDTRKANAELWDLVNWELSTATFTLAKQMQDNGAADNTNFADVSKEVLELLQKSLKLCDVEHAGSRQILYTFRSGLIHKRIASFHYSQLRANCSDAANISKTTLQICKNHYERAAHILESLKETNDYLIVQLERISLYEFLAEITSNNAQKIKQLQAALDICLQSQTLFEYAAQNATNSTIMNNHNEDFSKHLLLFESRLQNALKTLTKLLLSGKDPKKLSDLYKKMYMETLNGKRLASEQQIQTPDTQAQRLLKLLKRLSQHIAECSNVTE